MKSIRTIYKIGYGPSSSHSMGPARAATIFIDRLKNKPSKIKAVLYGSLAATGKGHLTDKAIRDAIAGTEIEFSWQKDKTLTAHPNGMKFIAYDNHNTVIDNWCVYSIGGGELQDDTGPITKERTPVYPANSFSDILDFSAKTNQEIWKYINEFEDDSTWTYLTDIWQTMKTSIEEGFKKTGNLPGPLKLQRRAKSLLTTANSRIGAIRDRNLLSAYALAVAEENASGRTIVTAPTCGSAGVVPAILYFFFRHYDTNIDKLLKALIIAGLIGTTVSQKASISGAEVGCQGEIGTACAMAAGAATFLMNGNNSQIEYATEMGLEHFLGLTCDPIEGLVQIPCIERNAFGAMRAMDCAAYALATEGKHLVELDDVIDVMNKTGRDLQCKYRETARGGLAIVMRNKLAKRKKTRKSTNCIPTV